MLHSVGNIGNRVIRIDENDKTYWCFTQKVSTNNRVLIIDGIRLLKIEDYRVIVLKVDDLRVVRIDDNRVLIIDTKIEHTGASLRRYPLTLDS